MRISDWSSDVCSSDLGQRCTSLRRLFVHEDVYDRLVPRLKRGWSSVEVGNPLEGALVGPLIDEAAYGAMEAALKDARVEGGTVQGGERLLADTLPGAWYARPALAEMPGPTPVTLRETFAPILYVHPHLALNEAIALPTTVRDAPPHHQF